LSSEIRALRELSNDPQGKFLSGLAKKFSEFVNKDQAEAVENPEDIYSDGQDVESTIKYHNFTMGTKFSLNKFYYSPFEPDAGKLRLWLIGDNTGSQLADESTFERVADIHGDPILVDGAPFDLGIATVGVKSIALRLNRPESETYAQDYIQVDAVGTTTLGVSGRTIGKSYFMRFRLFDLSSQGGQNRTLFQKIDDSTPSNGAMLIVTPTGQLRFHIKRAGVEYNSQTPSSTILVDTVYDVWCTYAVSGNVRHVYVNNVDQTLTDPGSPNFQGDLTNFDLTLFRRGLGSTGGYAYGDLYDFRIYDEDVTTFNSLGTCVFFDGVNDYIDCTNDVTLWSQALTKFSWSMWIYPTTVTGTDRFILEHGGGTAQGFRSYVSTGGALVFNCYDSGAVSKQASKTGVNVNQWNHVVGVYDNSLGSANVKCYLNKVVGATTANLTETLNKSATLRLSEATSDHQGYMRDFRFWDNKALTQTEINDIYDDSINAPIPDYRLPMLEGTGNAQDTISGTKTATLTNGASWINSEVGNHYENKWTISGIPFGQVLITNYSASHT
jgi:Concanavalin A-like lectin/glucanases superfamily